MVQFSRYWDGITTGDAGAYPADTYIDTWKKIFTRLDNEGVLDDYLNELVVKGITGGVSIASGGALVDGTFYENTSTVSMAISSPSANPRIDRIVLQKDWTNQTVRIAIVEGTEAGAPTAPALTQTSGSIWEIPLAQALITVAGAITVTDERDIANSPLVAKVGLEHIETIVSDGSLTQFDFENISQEFRHLKIIGQGRVSNANNPLGREILAIRYNGDSVSANYNLQGLLGTAGVISAAAFANFESAVFLFPNNNSSAGYSGQGTIFIPNYTQDDIYKTNNQRYFQRNDKGAGFDSEIVLNSGIWKNTDPIERITILSVDAIILASGSTCSLYGIF